MGRAEPGTTRHTEGRCWAWTPVLVTRRRAACRRCGAATPSEGLDSPVLPPTAVTGLQRRLVTPAVRGGGEALSSSGDSGQYRHARADHPDIGCRIPANTPILCRYDQLISLGTVRGRAQEDRSWPRGVSCATGRQPPFRPSRHAVTPFAQRHACCSGQLTCVFVAGVSQTEDCAVATRRGRQLALYRWPGRPAGELKGSRTRPGNLGETR